MIRDVHTTVFRELVEQAERDLAGYRRMLALAEQEARVGQVLPDPMMPLGQPWPAPPRSDYGTALQDAAWGSQDHGRPPVPGRQPYPELPSGPIPRIDGSELPPRKEQALDVLEAEHMDNDQSPKALKEQQKWAAS